MGLVYFLGFCLWWCIVEYIDEIIEESLEAESGLEEHMREYALSQISIDRHNEFKDRYCPVIIH